MSAAAPLYFRQKLPALAVVLAATAAVFVLLQFWRPYFFLTEDNLSAVLPAFADLGKELWKGAIPRTFDGLYAGSYPLWKDPGTLSLLHPFHIAAMLLAATRFRFAAIDAVCLANMLLGAAAMFACVRALCRRFGREIPDWFAGFLAVSYVTSTYSLGIGSSWLSFLGNQAAFPILLLGLLVRRPGPGIALFAAGMLHNLLGGHPSPFLFSLIFAGVFAGALSVVERSPVPVFRFAAGSAIALAIVSPALIPLLKGFAATSRSGVFPIKDCVRDNIPAVSLILGSTLGIDSVGAFSFRSPLWSFAEIGTPLGFSACALCFLAALLGAFRFRKPEWMLVGLLAVTALFIQRPLWLQTILAGLPLYKSLRWPMRETVYFLCFAHLLTGLVWSRMPRPLRIFVPPLSAGIYAIGILLMAPPTLNAFRLDRFLLLGGRANLVWGRVVEILKPGPDSMVVPLVERKTFDALGGRFVNHIPHTLTGGNNYPPLFGLKSATGYTMPGYAQKFMGHTPVVWMGYFGEPDFPLELRRNTPHLFTTVVSVDPMTLDYQFRDNHVRVVFPGGMEQPPVIEKRGAL